MNRKTFLLLLLPLLGIKDLGAQNLTFQEVAALAQTPDFFFNKNVNYAIENYDSAYYNVLSKPFDLSGLLTQQYTLPVFRNYLDLIDVDILYYFDSTSNVNGQIVFHNTKDLEEIKVQLSIEELCEANQYFDYLIIRGQRPSTSWRDIAAGVGLDTSQISNFKNSPEIDTLLLGSYYKTESFKIRNQRKLKLHGYGKPYLELGQYVIDGNEYFHLKYAQLYRQKTKKND